MPKRLAGIWSSLFRKDRPVTLIAWYVGALVLCTLGAFLAYGPLGSSVWRQWSGLPLPWIVEVVRAIGCTVLALFTIWNLRQAPSLSPEPENSFFPAKPRRYEWILIGVIAVAIVLFGLSWLPASMASGLSGRGLTGTREEVYGPYRPYLLYLFGLWVGIAFPALANLIRRLIRDWRWWIDARRHLHAQARESVKSEVDVARGVEAILNSFQEYASGLRVAAVHYLPVVLAVAIALVFEQKTGVIATSTDLAIDTAKITLWLLLGPALIALVGLVAVGYQSAQERVEAALRSIALRIPNDGSPDLLEKVRSARAEMMWDRSPGGFVLSVAKSASVSIPLALAVTAYAFRTLAGGGAWWELLLPRPLMNLIARLYGQ